MATDLVWLNMKRGSWIYTAPLLNIYDWLVPGLLNRFVWRVDTPLLHGQYRRCMGARHLDIGTGTGFFLKRCLADPGRRSVESLILMDASEASLDHACRQLAPHHPETVAVDVTAANSAARIAGCCVDSVSASYLIHCLPGGMRSIQPMLDGVRSALSEDGVFFGSTIPGTLARRRLLPRMTAAFFRWIGVFGNASDSPELLRQLLEKHFDEVETVQSGAVLLFEARCRSDRLGGMRDGATT